MRREQILIPVLRAVVARPRLTALAFARDPWGNPFADEVVNHPFGYIARMWEDGPVSYSKTFRRWFVVGYDECQYLAHHPDATAGATMDTLLDEIRPYSRLAPASKAFFQNWMLVRDGQEHTRIRKIVSSTFTPRRVAELEPMIEASATQLFVDIEADQSDTIEMVSAFNRPLPLNVICHMLGIPEADRAWIGGVVADLATFFDPFTKFDAGVVDAAVADFSSYFNDLADQRTADPRDDLITALAQAEADGDRLTQDELAANAALLIFAGHDTTTNVLGNALIALAEHPDQRELIRASPGLWPNAVEELLRYDTTAVAIARQTGVDITVGDITIPAGADVNLQLNAANRDPRRWDDPYELRLDRADPRPLAFGHGAHHCLGHALARLELKVALRHLVEGLGDYSIDHVEWRLSPNLRGPTNLTVTRGPRSDSGIGA